MLPQLRDAGAPAPDRRVTRRAVGRVLAAAAAAAAWGRPAAGAAPGSRGLDAIGGPIRIGSNENPYGLGPARARRGSRRRCRRPTAIPSTSSRASPPRSPREHEVGCDWLTVTPGSGEILRAATMAFTSPSLAPGRRRADLRGAGRGPRK